MPPQDGRNAKPATDRPGNTGRVLVRWPALPGRLPAVVANLSSLLSREAAQVILDHARSRSDQFKI